MKWSLRALSVFVIASIAACGSGSSTSSSTVVIAPTPTVAEPPAVSSAAPPVNPEPAASASAAPPSEEAQPVKEKTAQGPDPSSLVVSDGNPGEWTGEHGNYTSAITQVWGAGDLVYVVSPDGLLQSNDRGLTFKRATIPRMADGTTSVWGTGLDEIFVGGNGTVLRSIDRGVTWKAAGTPTPGFVSGFWGDKKDLYAIAARGVILHSSDRGVTWEQQAKDLKLDWLYGLWGRDRDVWAVGAGPSKPGDWSSTVALAHTSNGGKKWALVPIEASPLRGICGTDDGKLYVIDASGSLYRSKDRGKTWAKLIKFGSMELKALSCVGPNELYVGGRGRTFQHSIDGGKTWTDELAAQNKWTKMAFSMIEVIFPVTGGEVYVGGEGEYLPRRSPTGTLFRRR